MVGANGQKFIIFDYFRHEKLTDLVSPDGATLSAHIVEKLAGSIAPNQYAQATTSTPAAQVIGKIEKVSGSVTAVRNGVAVTLNVGDAVNKSDIVQTGSDSSCGISLLDGTALNLSANTRMALNDFLFDANAISGNGSHLTLVQGAFAFVSGLVAKTGGLNVETPVAVIGIRGTVGGASCADNGQCDYHAAPELNGQPSTFSLLTGGRFVDGQYVDGRSIGSVTLGADAHVVSPAPNAPPQVTFVAAAAANQGLANLTQNLVSSISTFTPGPPAPPGLPGPQGPQAPQGPQKSKPAISSKSGQLGAAAAGAGQQP